MTGILASRMKSKSDKVGTKIISGEGELLSGLLVPSAVQFRKVKWGIILEPERIHSLI